MHPAIYLVLTFISFLSSFVLTRWAIALSIRFEAFELPGHRKIHPVKVPNLGWIGIFGGWLIPLIFIAILVFALFGVRPYDPLISGMIRKMPTMVGIVIGAGLSLFFGWLDDRKKMSPLWKILVQVGLALLLFSLGVRITLFSSAWLSGPFTVLWVLCVMNAFNILDNLDGSCAGVAMIACALFLFVAAWLKQYFICLLLAGFLGALAGFLWFNFPPARIFMGNAGSSLMGYVMGTLTILETFYKKGVPTHLVVIMPILLLAVPIYDTISVILIRLHRRLPVYRGDTNHLAHRLLRCGMSGRQAVLTIYAVTAAAGMGSVFLPFVPTPTALFILAVCFCSMLGLGIWDFHTWHDQNR